MDYPSSYVDLQEKLASLRAEKIDDFISDEVAGKGVGASQIASSSLSILVCRPSQVWCITKLLHKVLKSDQAIADMIFRSCINQITQGKPFQIKVPFLYLLQQLVQMGDIQFLSLIPYIDPPMPDSIDLFASFFATEIDNWRRGYIRSLCLEPRKTAETRDFDSLRSILSGTFSQNDLPSALQRDDIDFLQTARPCPKTDSKVRMRIYEPCWFVNSNPTLIQYCAYFGSVKCFSYLLLNGADLNSTDRRGRNVAHYAVAGGNTEIIKAVESNSMTFEGCAQIAATFHRNLLFEWLIRRDTDLSALDSNGDSALVQSAAFDNIFCARECLLNGVDVNSRNGRKSTALHLAAANNHAEMVKFLLSVPGIDPNLMNESATPLTLAVMRNQMESVCALLESKLVDINRLDSVGPPILRACSLPDTRILEMILSDPRVDVNMADIQVFPSILALFSKFSHAAARSYSSWKQ